MLPNTKDILYKGFTLTLITNILSDLLTAKQRLCVFLYIVCKHLISTVHILHTHFLDYT